MVGTDARFADFTDAMMMEADLSYANLMNAELRSADLSHVRLDGAKLDGVKNLPPDLDTIRDKRDRDALDDGLFNITRPPDRQPAPNPK